MSTESLSNFWIWGAYSGLVTFSLILFIAEDGHNSSISCKLEVVLGSLASSQYRSQMT